MDSRHKETFYFRYFVVFVSALVSLVGIILLNYLSLVQFVTRRVCCPVLVIAGKLFILGLTHAVNCIMYRKCLQGGTDSTWS
jgi:hypothetical protein